MKCPRAPVKRRISRGSGRPGNYAHSIRGHSWLKKDGKTSCRLCGKVQ